MQEEINKPIFVIGAPRSVTSILTWCLGHHPNLFPVPESNWMGDFAVNIALSYPLGTARGYQQEIADQMDEHGLREHLTQGVEKQRILWRPIHPSRLWFGL
jgi:hypothetical protein